MTSRSVSRSASPDARRGRSVSPARDERKSERRAVISPSRSRSPSPARKSLSPRRRSLSPVRDRRRRSPSRSRSRDRRRRSRSPVRYGRSRSPRGGSATYSMPPRARTPPRVGLQMFVSGLNFACDEREVEYKFSKYGRVKEVRIVRNPMKYNESKGFGFVVMDSERAVQDAIRDLDGRDWNGRRLLLEVARNPR